MRSINKVIIIGNLTRNPEMRQTPNGQTVTTFGVATNREWSTREGDKKSSAEFHECVAWAKLAEICHKYLRKGRLVYIEGYLKTRSWDTPEGIKKFKTEIVIQDMIMLEKKPDDSDYLPENETFSSNNDTVETKTNDSPETTQAEESSNESEESSTIEHSDTVTEEPAPVAVVSESGENPIDKDLGL